MDCLGHRGLEAFVPCLHPLEVGEASRQILIRHDATAGQCDVDGHSIHGTLGIRGAANGHTLRRLALRRGCSRRTGRWAGLLRECSCHACESSLSRHCAGGYFKCRTGGSSLGCVPHSFRSGDRTNAPLPCTNGTRVVGVNVLYK